MLYRIAKRTFQGLALVLAALLLAGMGFYGYFQYRNTLPMGKLKPSNDTGLGHYVNPFIGTGGWYWVCAHNFPGASVPFGMVRLSPDTWSTVFRRKALNTSGYYYPDNRITGFSHTRLSGTGATDGGHFSVVPAAGDHPWTNYLKGNHLSFRHRDETAWPGYYSVQLKKPAVLAELTSTMRTGVHRYTFTKGVRPHLLLDICSALGDKRAEEAKVTVNPQTGELEGEVRTYGIFSGRYEGIKVFFYAMVDKEVAEATLWNGDSALTGRFNGEGPRLGVSLTFNPAETEQQIGLRIGLSHVSIANARMNLEAETSGKSFDNIVAGAAHAWEEKLSLIRLEGGSEREKMIFYTALYRSFQMPTLFQDVNREYLGFDKQVHSAEGYNYYTDMSLWDTFRTLHPLYTLIAREEQRDMLVSLVKMKEQGGWLPRWPSGNGYTNSMLGSPADMVISESYQKGIRDFDVISAYEGMKNLALGPVPPGSAFSGRRGIEHCLEYGYCPSDKMSQAVSRTLEYAWADYAIALLADSLGFREDAAMFYELAGNYKNTWNPATRYFQPRDSKGNFQEPFKPLLLTYIDIKNKHTDDYVEGSALQWRFAVPFDPGGLISLFGGEDAFVAELESFFARSNPAMSRWYPGPYYWHGNEPDIHAAFLFNRAGKPGLTQKWSRWILDNKYDVTANGLDGNDDGATLSSWYIFGALGFYPIAGTDIYQLGSPLFRKAVVNLGDKTLEIIAENYSPENRYVRQVSLNHRILDKWEVKHNELMEGGILRFKMSDIPME